MYCTTPIEIVWLDTTFIGGGFADCRLRDGTSGRIVRDNVTGKWQAYVKGIEFGPTCASWEDAAGQLGTGLLGIGVVMRLRG